MLVRAGMGCGAKLLIELRSVGRWRVDAHAGVRGGPARARARVSRPAPASSQKLHTISDRAVNGCATCGNQCAKNSEQRTEANC